MKLPKLRWPRIPWGRVTAGRALPWALAVVLLATTLTNWWLLRNDRAADARVAAVESVSRESLDALTNFSARTIDRDVGRLKRLAVGSFSTQVEQTFSPSRISQIRQADVRSTGRIKSLFVEDVSGDTASAFGVVDTTVVNNVSGSPRAEVVRFELSLIDTTGGWRIDQVNILQSPGSSSLSGG